MVVRFNCHYLLRWPIFKRLKKTRLSSFYLTEWRIYSKKSGYLCKLSNTDTFYIYSIGYLQRGSAEDVRIHVYNGASYFYSEEELNTLCVIRINRKCVAVKSWVFAIQLEHRIKNHMRWKIFAHDIQSNKTNGRLNWVKRIPSLIQRCTNP